MAEPSAPPPAQGKEWLASARREDLAGLKRIFASAGPSIVNYTGKGTSYGFVGNSALHWAAAKNNAAMAQWLLSAEVGADIDVCNSGGATALHSACANGSTALVQLLIERGADANVIDGNDETARDAATRRGFAAVARALDASLASASVRAQCDALRAVPEGEWPVKQMKQLLVAAGERAAAEGSAEKADLRQHVRRVLDAHAPAPWYAAGAGSGARKPAAAANGKPAADPPPAAPPRASAGAAGSAAEGAGGGGAAPPAQGKEWLASARSEDLAGLKRIFASAGPSIVNYTGKGTSYGFVGNSALHWAAAKNNAAMAQWLLSAEVGADIDLCNSGGATALHSACANGSTALVQLLIERGADANVIDGNDETARDAATRRGFAAVARALDASLASASVRAQCDALRAVPEGEWPVKQMKQLLVAAGERAAAEGSAEKADLRQHVRRVLDAHAPAPWFAQAAVKRAADGSTSAASARAAGVAPSVEPAGGRAGAEGLPAGAGGAGGGTGDGATQPAAGAAAPASARSRKKNRRKKKKAGARANAGAAEGESDADADADAESEDGTPAPGGKSGGATRGPSSADGAPNGTSGPRGPHGDGDAEHGGGAAHAAANAAAEADDDEAEEAASQAAAAAAAKQAGNTSFAEHNYSAALKHYSRAILLEPGSHVLYSNRSACHAALGDGIAALEDARACTRLAPGWPKGHGRVGAAFLLLAEPVLAVQAYEEGLRLEPQNEALRSGLEGARQALAQQPNSSDEDEQQSPPSARPTQAGGSARGAGASSRTPPPSAPSPSASSPRERGSTPTGGSLAHLPREAQWIEHAKNGSVRELRRLLAIEPTLLHTPTPNALGHTALHWAAARNKLECAEWLLEQGLAVDVRNKMGATPLHSAVANGCADLLELLLERGADPSATTDSGDAPRDLALDRGYPRLVELLDKRAQSNPARPPAAGSAASQRPSAAVPPSEPAASSGAAAQPQPAAGHTRESLRHLSYEQLIDLVLEMQARAGLKERAHARQPPPHHG